MRSTPGTGTFIKMRALATPALLATTLLSLSLAGCGANGDAKATDKTDGKSKPVSAPAKVTKLVIEDVKVGTGEPVKVGDSCSVRYTGKLGDGTEFDSNEAGGKPLLTFTAGPQGNVIRGWQEGIIGMKVGGERKLSIPSEMGYGAAGQGKITPNSDLFFTIKLDSVMKAGEEGVVHVKDTKPGTGREIKVGDTITIQHRGTLADGTEIDRGKWTFTIGKREVIPGIDQGVVGMKVGGTRHIVIPPMAGYGPLGKEPIIPANTNLIYDITVLSAK